MTYKQTLITLASEIDEKTRIVLHDMTDIELLNVVTFHMHHLQVAINEQVMRMERNIATDKALTRAIGDM